MNPPADPCQRWRERNPRYTQAGEPIETRRYGVELVADRDARAFVERHHYAASYPAARCRVGLYRARPWVTPELVGVAVFSVSASQAVAPKVTGLPPAEAVELGRLVMLDDVPGNGESWFLGHAFRLLHQALPEVRAVLAYSDPVERSTLDGRRVKPGHIGIIYQSHNGRHVGRSKRSILVLARDGSVVSARALSKLRTDDQGAAYAYRQLIALGAPHRHLGESGPAYVTRALAEGPFRRLPHPGNLAYCWPLGDRRERRETVKHFPPALPYPVGDALVRMA